MDLTTWLPVFICSLSDWNILFMYGVFLLSQLFSFSWKKQYSEVNSINTLLFITSILRCFIIAIIIIIIIIIIITQN
jgi:hypothetical protein